MHDDLVTILVSDTVTGPVQALMRADLVATVEIALQRDVVAFMSASHVDPDLAVETFVLAPRRAGDGD